MKILIDMNLSPTWAERFEQEGWQAWHWSEIGDARAPDSEIMEWARNHECLVFTHDLDFGALLSSTGATGPSVIQLRSEDTRPESMDRIVITSIRLSQNELKEGALVTVDPRKMRVTLLPLRKRRDAAKD